MRSVEDSKEGDVIIIRMEKGEKDYIVSIEDEDWPERSLRTNRN